MIATKPKIIKEHSGERYVEFKEGTPRFQPWDSRKFIPDEDWHGEYAVSLRQYKTYNQILWSVSLNGTHIKVTGLNSRKQAIEVGRSLVQAYCQGIYSV